jgi:hypothetical protein
MSSSFLSVIRSRFQQEPGELHSRSHADQSGGAAESNWALNYTAEAGSKTGFGSKRDESGMKFPRWQAPIALVEYKMEI